MSDTCLLSIPEDMTPSAILRTNLDDGEGTIMNGSDVFYSAIGARVVKVQNL